MLDRAFRLNQLPAFSHRKSMAFPKPGASLFPSWEKWLTPSWGEVVDT